MGSAIACRNSRTGYLRFYILGGAKVCPTLLAGVDVLRIQIGEISHAHFEYLSFILRVWFSVSLGRLPGNGGNELCGLGWVELDVVVKLNRLRPKVSNPMYAGSVTDGSEADRV